MQMFVDSIKYNFHRTTGNVQARIDGMVHTYDAPYVFGNKVGTRLLVKGVQIIELASGNGSVDSGDLSADDVAAIFGLSIGFKQSDPQVRKAEEDEAEAADSYDF